MQIRRLFVAAAFFSAASAFAAETDGRPSLPFLNRPWYPSLQAFEHYDSGRSHVFSQAEFRGSFNGRNTVVEERSREFAYPSGYNTSYLNQNDAFIQGGSYGNLVGSIGPFVAKINQSTLEHSWFTLLRNAKHEQEWNYPGAMGILNNGYIYVVSGYRIYKVHPDDGHVVDTLVLPTTVYMRNNYPDTPATYDSTPTEYAANTSYNGLNAMPDGIIILKSLYRAQDCPQYDGPSAILTCPDSRNVPQSVLVSVDPRATPMRIISQITLPNPVGARPTITRYKSVDYVYLLANTSLPVRYIVKDGHFAEDKSWQPPAVANCGQQPGGSLIVMGDWIVGATNTAPATEPLTLFAVHQGNAKYISVQPFKDDPLPPGLAAAFQTAAPTAGNPLCSGFSSSQINLPATSWAGMSPEADPETGLFYSVDTLRRKVAAFRIVGGSKIETVWKKEQTTTEWATLIGPKQHRVWVGTDIPLLEIPGRNKTNTVVWRNAGTGRELARSGEIPHMTQGSAVQPGYDGSMYFPGAEGMLIRLTPRPDHRPHGGDRRELEDGTDWD